MRIIILISAFLSATCGRDHEPDCNEFSLEGDFATQYTEIAGNCGPLQPITIAFGKGITVPPEITVVYRGRMGCDSRVVYTAEDITFDYTFRQTDDAADEFTGTLNLSVKDGCSSLYRVDGTKSY